MRRSGKMKLQRPRRMSSSSELTCDGPKQRCGDMAQRWVSRVCRPQPLRPAVARHRATTPGPPWAPSLPADRPTALVLESERHAIVSSAGGPRLLSDWLTQSDGPQREHLHRIRDRGDYCGEVEPVDEP